MDTTRHRIVSISGSSRRPSRSQTLAGLIARRVAAHVDADIVQYDLLDGGDALGLARRREDCTGRLGEMLAAIETADVLVAVSPVYKGSYAGLFKHLFDLVDMDALVGRPVVIGATGGGPRHALMVEHQMRPLFGFFSALTVPTAVYAEDADFDGDQLADPGVLARIEAAAIQCAELAAGLGCRRDAARQEDSGQDGSGRIVRFPTGA